MERITIELIFNGTGWKRKFLFDDSDPDMTPEQFREAYIKESNEGNIDLAEEAMYCDRFRVTKIEVDEIDIPTPVDADENLVKKEEV